MIFLQKDTISPEALCYYRIYGFSPPEAVGTASRVRTRCKAGSTLAARATASASGRASCRRVINSLSQLHFRLEPHPTPQTPSDRGPTLRPPA